MGTKCLGHLGLLVFISAHLLPFVVDYGACKETAKEGSNENAIEWVTASKTSKEDAGGVKDNFTSTETLETSETSEEDGRVLMEAKHKTATPVPEESTETSDEEASKSDEDAEGVKHEITTPALEESAETSDENAKVLIGEASKSDEDAEGVRHKITIHEPVESPETSDEDAKVLIGEASKSDEDTKGAIKLKKGVEVDNKSSGGSEDPEQKVEPSGVHCGKDDVVDLGNGKWYEFSLDEEACDFTVKGSEDEKCSAEINCTRLNFKEPDSKRCQPDSVLKITDTLGGSMTSCGKDSFGGPYRASNHGRNLHITYKGQSPETVCQVTCGKDRVHDFLPLLNIGTAESSKGK